MAGGEPGALGHNTVMRADGHIEQLGHIGKTDMHPGDVFIIETPGGGGYLGLCPVRAVFRLLVHHQPLPDSRHDHFLRTHRC
jgi:N-methylhydantoinase B/oxoprolinase/acetone carboxylase alpha subunit